MTAPPVLPGGPPDRPNPLPAMDAGTGPGPASCRVPWASVLALGGLAGLIGLTLLWNHKPAGQFFFPRCTFYAWTGLQCPGCGGLRATHELLHGNVAEAWRLNALFVTSLPVAAWTAVALLIERWTRLSPPHPLRFRHLWVAVLILVLGFGLFRNL